MKKNKVVLSAIVIVAVLASFLIGMFHGYSTGQAIGYEAGESDGLKRGYVTGRLEGAEVGYQAGLKVGEGMGYAEGFAAASVFTPSEVEEFYRATWIICINVQVNFFFWPEEEAKAFCMDVVREGIAGEYHRESYEGWAWPVPDKPAETP